MELPCGSWWSPTDGAIRLGVWTTAASPVLVYSPLVSPLVSCVRALHQRHHRWGWDSFGKGTHLLDAEASARGAVAQVAAGEQVYGRPVRCSIHSRHDRCGTLLERREARLHVPVVTKTAAVGKSTRRVVWGGPRLRTNRAGGRAGLT